MPLHVWGFHLTHLNQNYFIIGDAAFMVTSLLKGGKSIALEIFLRNSIVFTHGSS